MQTQRSPLSVLRPIVAGGAFALTLALVASLHACGPSGATLPDSLAGFGLGALPPEVTAELHPEEELDCYEYPHAPSRYCTLDAAQRPGVGTVRLLSRQGRLYSIEAVLDDDWDSVPRDTMVAELTTRFGAPPDSTATDSVLFVARWDDPANNRHFRLHCYTEGRWRACAHQLTRQDWTGIKAESDSMRAAWRADVDSAQQGLTPTVDPHQLWQMTYADDPADTTGARDLLGHTIRLPRVEVGESMHWQTDGRMHYLVTTYAGYGSTVFVYCDEPIRTGRVLSLTGTLRPGVDAYEGTPLLERVQVGPIWLETESCERPAD